MFGKIQNPKVSKILQE